MATRTLNRAGLPTMQIVMLPVLQRLRDAERLEQPFVHLNEDDVHDSTIKALIERDWIVCASKGLEQERTYRITGRGLKALKVYEAPPARRTDGMCCRCCEFPRGVYTTGRKKPYCDSCEKALYDRKMALGIYYVRERICPVCKTRPVRVCSTGFIKHYCAECERARNKLDRNKKMKRLLSRIRAGEHLPCPDCGRQRYHTAKAVYDRCYECHRRCCNEWERGRATNRKRAS